MDKAAPPADPAAQLRAALVAGWIGYVRPSTARCARAQDEVILGCQKGDILFEEKLGEDRAAERRHHSQEGQAMNRIFASAAIIVTILGGAGARGAGPYDGKWAGTAPDAGDCGVLTVTMIVKDNVITGNVSGKHGSPYIRSGTIGADGSAQINYTITGDRGFDGSARFVGNQFSGQFMSRCGVRQVAGARQ